MEVWINVQVGEEVKCRGVQKCRVERCSWGTTATGHYRKQPGYKWKRERREALTARQRQLVNVQCPRLRREWPGH